MGSLRTNTNRWWRVADRVGASASFLCAIHCALLPFVLALLPFVGLEFLAGHRFERIFVSFAAALALFALVNGYRRHKVALPLMLALPGLALLLFGVTYAERYTLLVHSALVTCGGLLLAAAHFVNLHRDRIHTYRQVDAGGEVHVHGPHCARSLWHPGSW